MPGRLRPRPPARRRSARSRIPTSGGGSSPTSPATSSRRSARSSCRRACGPDAAPGGSSSTDRRGRPSSTSSPAGSSSSTCRRARAPSPSSSSATPSGSGRADATSPSTSAAGSAASSSTCATSRSDCPSGPTAGASCSRPGRRRSGRGWIATTAAPPAAAASRAERPAPAPGLDLVARAAARPRPARRHACRSARATGRVAAGRSVVPGTPLAERLRDARLVEAGRPTARPARPAIAGGRRRRRRSPPPARRTPEGELLFESSGRWRIAAGEHLEPARVAADRDRPRGPARGSAIAHPGRRARRSRASIASATPTRGRLEIATERDGELLPRSLDVGAAGAILVVGARIDAEALTRARAMGIRGVVVAALAGKDRRDFLASEARQRAALHRLPPFARARPRRVGPPADRRGRDGAARGAGRPRGRDRRPTRRRSSSTRTASSSEPPAADVVRVRSGPLAGARARWAGLAGPAPVRRRDAPRGGVRPVRRRRRRSRSRSPTSSGSPERRSAAASAGRRRAHAATFRYARAVTLPAVAERDRPARPRDDASARRGPRRASPARRPVCLWGELGAGKTQLAKGFGAGLGVRRRRSTRRRSS